MVANGKTTGTANVKIGMAKMLKGGVIMDVVTPEQARIARSPASLKLKRFAAPRAPPSRAPCARALPPGTRVTPHSRRPRRRAPWP